MKKQPEEETVTTLRRSAADDRAFALAAHRLTARRQRDLLPVKITTPRLVLRPPIRGDVPDLVRLADNARIHAVLSRLPSPYTRADGIAFVEIFAQRADERPFAITMGDRFIGVVGFTFVEGVAPELGYWLGEPYWGKGIMTEAVKALLNAAFSTHAYPRVVARALTDNAGSLKVLEKAGFRRTGDALDAKDRSVVLLEMEQPKWM